MDVAFVEKIRSEKAKHIAMLFAFLFSMIGMVVMPFLALMINPKFVAASIIYSIIIAIFVAIILVEFAVAVFLAIFGIRGESKIRHKIVVMFAITVIMLFLIIFA